LTKEEKKARKELFGKFRDGFRKLKPYYFRLDDEKKIMEIPVTTLPILRLPFHLSYLIYISNISLTIMKVYLFAAIFLCKLTRTPISFLLHPLDIIGGDKIQSLAFFPGMNIISERKVMVFREVLERIKKSYKLVCLSTLHKQIESIC
jgi:hypothetical protein